jgi:hypothetical protein
MITTSQSTEIQHYLASKKLQSDLIVEVQDHFLSQISQLMITKNIGFEEAFLHTKILWMGELRIVKASFLSFKKITVIEKKIVNKRLNRILLNSIFLLPFIFGLNYFLPDSVIFIQIFLSIVLFFLVGLSLLKNKLKFRDYLFLGFHPLILKTLLIGFFLRFLLMPISTSFMSPDYMMEFLKSNFLLTAFAFIVQIQLLYLNFKNKKVLL